MSTKKAIISLEDKNPQTSIIVQLEGKDYPYAWVAHDFKKNETSYKLMLDKNEAILGSSPADVGSKIEQNLNRGDVSIGADLLEIASLVLKQKQRSRESAIEHEINELESM